MRISICGLEGSGKSTLAERISKKFDIPHLHIDRLWFEIGGYLTQRNSDEWKKARLVMQQRVDVLIEQESWVADGWQGLTVRRADQIVFLDIPLWRRLLNLLYRMCFERRHNEVSFWDDIKFFPEVVRRTSRNGPPIRKLVEDNKSKATILHNYQEVEQFFSNLK